MLKIQAQEVIRKVILESIKGTGMWNTEERRARKGMHLSCSLRPGLLGNSLQNHPLGRASKLGYVSPDSHLPLTVAALEADPYGPLLQVVVLLMEALGAWCLCRNGELGSGGDAEGHRQCLLSARL